MTTDDVLIRVREHVEIAGSLRKLADRWNISAAYLCDVLGGRRSPGPAILKWLNLRKVREITVRYVDEPKPKGKKV